MNKKSVLQSLVGLFLLSILFTPKNSDIWLYFLLRGLTFGVLWFIRL
ncbi:MAG: hypothetical protein ABH811_02570 [archaeon]